MSKLGLEIGEYTFFLGLSFHKTLSVWTSMDFFCHDFFLLLTLFSYLMVFRESDRRMRDLDSFGPPCTSYMALSTLKNRPFSYQYSCPQPH